MSIEFFRKKLLIFKFFMLKGRAVDESLVMTMLKNNVTLEPKLGILDRI